MSTGSFAGYRGTTGRLAPPVFLALVGGVHGVAVAVNLTGWAASRGASAPDGQIPWVVFGACATSLSVAVNVAWVLVARRAVGARQRDVAVRIGALRDRYPVAMPAGVVDGATQARLAVEGARLYHRAGCALLDGRSPVLVGKPDHDAAGRRPCGWCAP